mmetsp:Transcript_24798/g.49562  ORF Transcript_24798/g.49562 Transcript_24798/m.49562 type:complete len:125 (-) Transcript_24798:255-629(-)
MALTVGVRTVMEAREVLIIVTGLAKSVALHMCVEEGVNHMWTVSAIQEHAKALLVCDEEATMELKVKTVRYFKSLSTTTAKMAEEKAHKAEQTDMEPLPSSSSSKSSRSPAPEQSSVPNKKPKA